MTSFLATTFAVIGHKPETICAVLANSREMMNCSAVPVILSTDKTWGLLRYAKPKSEGKLLQLFSDFSDTMQFTEKLRIQNYPEKDFVKGILENLVKNKRYFSRTIRLLQLPSPSALIEACSSQSSTATTPILLSNLRSLTLEDSNTLRNEHLKTICLHCPFLVHLNIPCQWYLTDEAVEFLSHLKCLKTLDLYCCIKITNNGLQHLEKLSSLRSLNLGGCYITDSSLEHLAELSALETLNLEYCQKITDSGLEHLAKLSSLQSLNLGWCNKITDSGLQHLANISSLQTLRLTGCDKITDEGCRVLTKSTKVNR